MAEYNQRDKSRTSGRIGEKKMRWLGSWVPRRLEMYLSPAWQKAPRPLIKILERLEVEHLRHGGKANGELYVAYSQFVAAGVSKRSILRTLDLGCALGFLEVTRQEEARGDIRPPNAYRLTYVPAIGKNNPTDEWKSLTEERVDYLLGQYRVEEETSSRATRRKVS